MLVADVLHKGVYGEAEFVFASIKVVTIIGLIVSVGSFLFFLLI